jgi:hypothetical protein
MATRKSDPIFGNVIHSYSRAEAIADGELVDVSKQAQEAGITFPTAVTRRVWAELITPDPRSVPMGQSIEGRLWDTVWMLKCAIRLGNGGRIVRYQVIYVLKEKQRRTITLKAVCGPGDTPEPVITIMFPDED